MANENDRRQNKLERLEARAEHELAVARYAEREFEYDPITEVPDEVKLTPDYFDEVRHKVEYNIHYSEYYYLRYEDTNLVKYANISERVANCHKSWFGDKYKQSGVFNVKRVFHCHNRWCWLCNHLKQAKKLYEYELRFDTLLKDYDLYHTVFTVPNCSGDVLKDTLERMQLSLKKIIRYFQGHGSISGIDLMQYGFVGAIRSFEIVINPTDYHPHLHCLFLLKKDLDLVKTHTNKFSFDKGVFKRKFTDLEIFLQKAFYLSMNKQKVNPKNLRAIKLGYSCIMDLVDNENTRWHEMFKYATKMSKDGTSFCTYKQFRLLDDILYKFKMIQGYGIFYNADKENAETDPTAEILFEKVLILLNRKETPERDVNLQLDKLVDELHNKKLTVISKKLSYRYLKSVYDDLKAELNLSDDYSEPF